MTQSEITTFNTTRMRDARRLKLKHQNKNKLNKRFGLFWVFACSSLPSTNLFIFFLWVVFCWCWFYVSIRFSLEFIVCSIVCRLRFCISLCLVQFLFSFESHLNFILYSYVMDCMRGIETFLLSTVYVL